MVRITNSSSLLVAMCAAPGVLLAVGIGFAGASMLSGGTMWLVGALAVAVACGLSVLAIRLHLLAPLSRMRASLAALREVGGQLPDELPVHRSDEIGSLAREVALIAGDRNVS
ncbi:MAG TPA: HAMP domain-containing protein, partial [Vicinamibacteria bacterium]|nr:HAMP domain-containing protein [Vicinamibacteria bacterium]